MVFWILFLGFTNMGQNNWVQNLDSTVSFRIILTYHSGYAAFKWIHYGWVKTLDKTMKDISP